MKNQTARTDKTQAKTGRGVSAEFKAMIGQDIDDATLMRYQEQFVKMIKEGAFDI